MTHKLIPCPFCPSGKAEFGKDAGIYVGCVDCGIRSPSFDSKLQAYEYWNERPLEETLYNDNMKLRKAYNTAIDVIKALREAFDLPGIRTASMAKGSALKAARKLVGEK